MIKRFLARFTLLVLTLSGPFTARSAGYGFQLDEWSNPGRDKGAVFAICEYKDGILHLKDDADGQHNNFLQQRFFGAKLAPFKGRQVLFEAEVRLISANRVNCVGLSVNYKDRAGETVSHSAHLPGKEASDWQKISLVLPVPADATAFGAVIECARGYGGKAEAEFRNIVLRTLDDDETVWQTVAGYVMRRDNKAMLWRWSAEPAACELTEFGLAVKAAATLKLAPAAPHILLTGSTPDQGQLLFDVSDPTPFQVEFLSWGKSNTPVPVVPVADKAGRYRIGVPLERFGTYHDLAQFEGLILHTEGPQTFKVINLTGLDKAAEVVNILPDASFEEALTPAVNFNLWGDNRPEAVGARYRYDDKAWHGKRSLLIEPGGFFTWFAHDQRSKGAVFSVYAESDAPGEFQLTFQDAQMEHHGSTNAPITRQNYLTAPGWQRYVLPVADTGKQSSVEFNLYRVEVRNIGATPIRFDAAQLELDVTEARAFNPVRGSKFNYRIKETVSLEQSPRLEIPAQEATGEVRFRTFLPAEELPYYSTSVETAPVSAPSPARGGIPFRAGELFDPAQVQLFDTAGNPVAAQFTALARRPLDGSVISLAVDFIPATPNGEYILKYGPDVTPSNARKPLAEQLGDRIVIDTGKARYEITSGEISFLSTPTGEACFAVLTPDGKLHRSAAEIVRIEENGPETCTIFLRGAAFFGWEIRLTAWHGQSYLKIDCSFENNFGEKDPLYRLVRAIYLQLPGGGEEFEAMTRVIRAGEYAMQHLVKTGGAWRLVPEGEALPVPAVSASFTFEEIAELAPRSVRVAPDALRFYLWPEEQVSPLDVAAGLSGSMRIWYDPSGGALPRQLAALYPDPARIAASGVFGEILSRDEVAAAFPKTGRMIDHVFDAARGYAKLAGFYGFADYGDFGTRNFYRNHETAGVRNLWTRFLSTGDPADFTLAEAHSRHMRDVDQCHIRYGASAVHPHNSWSNFTWNFHTGHYWNTGVVWHYLLTGDRRSLESALSSAAVLIQKSSIQYKAGRERHRMIFHLAELYELSGNPVIRRAFERQYEHGGESEPAGYYGGIAHEALYKLYEVTGEEKYLDRLKQEIVEFRKTNKENLVPMPEDRTQAPTVAGSANEGRQAMTLVAGATAARLFDDPAYLSYLWKGEDEAMLWHTLSPISRDNSLAWTLPYLAVMKRYGLEESPITPDSYSDLNRLTGSMQIARDEPFILQLDPGPDGNAVLDVYRIRSFRYWQYKRKGDKITVIIRDADGKVLAEETIYENVVTEQRRFTVPANNRPVTAEVTFHRNCWGGVSSPNPYRISADRWFAARTSLVVPVEFGITLPDSGKLTMHWRWKNGENIRSGDPLAIAITVGDETISKAFIIPPEYPDDANGIATYRMELDIPPHLRGRPARLQVTDLKWIEWKLDPSAWLSP